MNADRQGQSVSRKPGQCGAALLHFAGPQNSGLGGIKCNLKTIALSIDDRPQIDRRNAFQSIQAALQAARPSGRLEVLS